MAKYRLVVSIKGLDYWDITIGRHSKKGDFHKKLFRV